MEKRTLERVQEICESGGFAAGYAYMGQALSRDPQANEQHNREASAYAALIAGSTSVPIGARKEVFRAARAAYVQGYMRGRIARSTIPPLAVEGLESLLAPAVPRAPAMPREAHYSTAPAREAREPVEPLDGVVMPTSADGLITPSLRPARTDGSRGPILGGLSEWVNGPDESDPTPGPAKRLDGGPSPGRPLGSGPRPGPGRSS